MIDIHCHALPEVDDGAADGAEGLRMLAMAVEDGVTHLVLTPHFSPANRPLERLETLKTRFTAFKPLAARACPGLRLRLAAEVMICPEIVEMAADGTLPFLGKWDEARVFLMEFEPHSAPHWSLALIQKLREMGIIPLIAHPERNLEFQASPGRLAPYIAAGCLLQITSGSLTGRFGKGAYKAAEAILKNGWAGFIATDSHNAGPRSPDLAEGVRMAAGIVGEEEAAGMVSANQRKLFRDAGPGLA